MGKVPNFTDNERFKTPKTDFLLKFYTGRDVVRMSHIRSVTIKTAKISSVKSGRISAKFAPAKSSRYTVYVLFHVM